MTLDTGGAHRASPRSVAGRSWQVSVDLRLLPSADELAFADLALHLSDHNLRIARVAPARAVLAMVVPAGSKEEAEAYVRGLLGLYQERHRWWYSTSVDAWLELPT